MLPPSNMLEESPTVAEISLKAFHHNVEAIKRLVGNRILLAVIKTNAYGHGIMQVAKEAINAGAERLGVTTIKEGMLLRQSGISVPIHLLSPISPSQVDVVVFYQLIASISSREVAQALSKVATRYGNNATVHLKINTGLQRFGIEPNEAKEFCERCFSLPGLRWEGIYTHFSSADEGNWKTTEKQFQLYMDTVNRLNASGYVFSLHHVGASTIAIERKDMHLDMVRPGISLFGYPPAARQNNKISLQPVMCLKTKLVQVRTLPPNTKVGYGGEYITKTTEKIGILPIGHGDGFKRGLSNNGKVIVKGQKVDIIGTISLDQTFINVSQVPGVMVGDEVTLIGMQGNEVISAKDVADWLNSNVDEVLSSFMDRVRRVYI
ncbi:alanine racemase [Oceanobacillus bengalensis]|uniref:Alanine racemase n=1 Tax=Oceanobacillus bengalensis TaxID=1435466 RepID=A0A494YXT2_9BACI|nr:alanine racemase [Oceanobacillus bengalensis]RKQ14933.1 alanine racemase [Oceanobacillus bengalensis]